MAFTFTVKDCNGNNLDNATIGNGKCYTHSNGTYTFTDCDNIKANNGGNAVTSLTASPNTLIPYSGGNFSFEVGYYGGSFVGQKGDSWSGNASVPSSICPTTAIISGTAGENTNLYQRKFTFSIGSFSESVTQDAKPWCTSTGVSQVTFTIYSNAGCYDAAMQYNPTITGRFELSCDRNNVWSGRTTDMVCSGTSTGETIGITYCTSTDENIPYTLKVRANVTWPYQCTPGEGIKVYTIGTGDIRRGTKYIEYAAIPSNDEINVTLHPEISKAGFNGLDLYLFIGRSA